MFLEYTQIMLMHMRRNISWARWHNQTHQLTRQQGCRDESHSIYKRSRMSSRLHMVVIKSQGVSM